MCSQHTCRRSLIQVITTMLAVSGVGPNVLIPDSESLDAQTHFVNTAARWSQDDKGGASISE